LSESTHFHLHQRRQFISSTISKDDIEEGKTGADGAAAVSISQGATLDALPGPSEDRSNDSHGNASENDSGAHRGSRRLECGRERTDLPEEHSPILTGSDSPMVRQMCCIPNISESRCETAT
jgi:hypothetical protein